MSLNILFVFFRVPLIGFFVAFFYISNLAFCKTNSTGNTLDTRQTNILCSPGCAKSFSRLTQPRLCKVEDELSWGFDNCHEQASGVQVSQCSHIQLSSLSPPFSPPSQPFLIEKVILQKLMGPPKNQKPRRPFWGPLAAILDFIGVAGSERVPLV